MKSIELSPKNLANGPLLELISSGACSYIFLSRKGLFFRTNDVVASVKVRIKDESWKNLENPYIRYVSVVISQSFCEGTVPHFFFVVEFNAFSLDGDIVEHRLAFWEEDSGEIREGIIAEDHTEEEKRSYLFPLDFFKRESKKSTKMMEEEVSRPSYLLFLFYLYLRELCYTWNFYDLFCSDQTSVQLFRELLITNAIELLKIPSKELENKLKIIESNESGKKRKRDELQFLHPVYLSLNSFRSKMHHDSALSRAKEEKLFFEKLKQSWIRKSVEVLKSKMEDLRNNDLVRAQQKSILLLQETIREVRSMKNKSDAWKLLKSVSKEASKQNCIQLCTDAVEQASTGWDNLEHVLEKCSQILGVEK